MLKKKRQKIMFSEKSVYFSLWTRMYKKNYENLYGGTSLHKFTIIIIADKIIPVTIMVSKKEKKNTKVLNTFFFI